MGLQWAIDNDMDIVNMSFGYRKDSPAVRRAVQEVHKAGIIMIAAWGNRSNYDDSVILEGLGDGGILSLAPYSKMFPRCCLGK